jgi:hypothetical protein
MQSSGQYKKNGLTFWFFYINKVQIYDKRTKNHLDLLKPFHYAQQGATGWQNGA